MYQKNFMYKKKNLCIKKFKYFFLLKKRVKINK